MTRVSHPQGAYLSGGFCHFKEGHSKVIDAATLKRWRLSLQSPRIKGNPLSQDDAAHLAGVTQKAWQKWESGAASPRLQSLNQILVALLDLAIEQENESVAAEIRAYLLPSKETRSVRSIEERVTDLEERVEVVERRDP